MEIIDSHVHFWDPQQLRYTWLDGLPTINRPFLTDHVPLRVGDDTIAGIVFVQAAAAADQGLAEVDFVSRLAAQDARVRGIVAFAALEQGARVRPYLEALKQNPLVKGVRRLIQDEEPGFSTQPRFVTAVQLLAQYDFTFDICIRHWQFPDALELARECPNVHFVLDHIGKPDIKNQLRKPWRAQLGELAALPNVWCKLSGLVTEADADRWRDEDLQPYIEHVIAAFGIDRVMYGSDAPVQYLASTYERWVETLQAATSSLSDADKQKLWHDNPARFYGL